MNTFGSTTQVYSRVTRWRGSLNRHERRLADQIYICKDSWDRLIPFQFVLPFPPKSVSLLVKIEHFPNPGLCRPHAPGRAAALDEATGDAGREFLGLINTVGFHGKDSKRKTGER